MVLSPNCSITIAPFTFAALRELKLFHPWRLLSSNIHVLLGVDVKSMYVLRHVEIVLC